MNHQFDIGHAILFGMSEAVFINNFQYWLKQNASNERNIRDGKPWTYNTHKAYCKQFPYMTEHQIRRVLESLVSKGVLEKAKLNDNKYDHTLWYSFTDEFLAQNPLFDLAENPDQSGLNHKTLTSTNKNTDKNPEDTPRKRVSSAKTTLSQYLEQCQAEGRKPIPDDHCSRKYAADAGISPEMIALAWFSFVDTYRDGTGKAKKYADWGLAFNNAVKGNWAKLWYVARDSGTVNWTSEGLLYKATIDAKLGNS